MKFMSYLIQNGMVEGVKFNAGLSGEVTDEAQIKALKHSRFAEIVKESTKAEQQAEIDVAMFNDNREEEVVDIKALEDCSYKELKAICKKEGYTQSGKTAELLARIIEKRA